MCRHTTIKVVCWGDMCPNNSCKVILVPVLSFPFDKMILCSILLSCNINNKNPKCISAFLSKLSIMMVHISAVFHCASFDTKLNCCWINSNFFWKWSYRPHQIIFDVIQLYGWCTNWNNYEDANYWTLLLFSLYRSSAAAWLGSDRDKTFLLPDVVISCLMVIYLSCLFLQYFLGAFVVFMRLGYG